MSTKTIIIQPDVTEKSMKLLETENKLVFVVARDSNKREVKHEVESLYAVKVKEVRTCITPKGLKKAYVRFMPEYKADEIATRIGIF